MGRLGWQNLHGAAPATCQRLKRDDGLGLVMPVTKQAYFLMHRRRYGPEAMISSSRQILVTNASGTIIQVLDYYPWWPSGLSLPRMHDMLRAAACGALECALIVVEDVKANRRR
jgi:hypothetical protein